MDELFENLFTTIIVHMEFTDGIQCKMFVGKCNNSKLVHAVFLWIAKIFLTRGCFVIRK